MPDVLPSESPPLVTRSGQIHVCHSLSSPQVQSAGPYRIQVSPAVADRATEPPVSTDHGHLSSCVCVCVCALQRADTCYAVRQLSRAERSADALRLFSVFATDTHRHRDRQTDRQ